jgi:hypothetical protein
MHAAPACGMRETGAAVQLLERARQQPRPERRLDLPGSAAQLAGACVGAAGNVAWLEPAGSSSFEISE